MNDNDIKFITKIAPLIMSSDVECRKLAISLIESEYPDKQTFREYINVYHKNWIGFFNFNDYIYDRFFILDYIFHIFDKYDLNRITTFMDDGPRTHLFYNNMMLV